MKQDTSEIIKELGLCDSSKTFYNENKDYMIRVNLSSLSNSYMHKYSLKKSQVIRNSELSETYAYQIFSGLRVPERNKLLCLAIAMELNQDEVQTLLKSSGYSQLYVKLPFDSTIGKHVVKLIIPASIINMHSFAFQNCNNLRDVYFCGNPIHMNGYTFCDSKIAFYSTDMTLHCSATCNDRNFRIFMMSSVLMMASLFWKNISTV